ncbi:MAG: type II secretion system protein [Burkholderiales bacterium]
MTAACSPTCRARRAGGFTYVGLLILVAVIAGASASALSFGASAQRRMVEEELLFVGMEFRAAIASFHQTAQGLRRYPRDFDELLKDPRDPGVKRHLRRVYPDPLTGRPEWGIVRAPDGGIMGVHSLSRDTPIKQANFPEDWKEFEGKSSYRDWQFVFAPSAVQPAGAAGGAPRAGDAGPTAPVGPTAPGAPGAVPVAPGIGPGTPGTGFGTPGTGSGTPGTSPAGPTGESK